MIPSSKSLINHDSLCITHKWKLQVQTFLVISSASSESIILDVPINDPMYPPPAAGW